MLVSMQEVNLQQHHRPCSIGCLAISSVRALFAFVHTWTFDCKFGDYQHERSLVWA